MLRAWNASLDTMVGRFVHLETHDGSFREGRVTGVEYQTTMVNKRKIELPKAIELNGDPSDKIEWSWIKIITVDV